MAIAVNQFHLQKIKDYVENPDGNVNPDYAHCN